MMDLYGKLIGQLSNYLYGYILIVLLLGGGIYFTIRTKGVQLKYLAESLRIVLEPAEDGKDSISSFQALMVSTASRVGTGNIAGISTAICIGGSGAVFWMWKARWPRFTSAAPKTEAVTAARPTTLKACFTTESWALYTLCS